MRSITNKAHSTIILCLSDGVLREVAKENTISSLWTKLKELFLKKSSAKILYMKWKLYTFSMKERTIVKDHLDEFNKLILDLENVNIILEDKDRALIMLSSLSDSYEHFVDTLLYGRQSLTLKDVNNALKSKDLKKGIDGKDQNLGESLVAKINQTSKPIKKKTTNRTKLIRKERKRSVISATKRGIISKIVLRRKNLKNCRKKLIERSLLPQKMKENQMMQMFLLLQKLFFW